MQQVLVYGQCPRHSRQGWVACCRSDDTCIRRPGSPAAAVCTARFPPRTWHDPYNYGPNTRELTPHVTLHMSKAYSICRAELDTDVQSTQGATLPVPLTPLRWGDVNFFTCQHAYSTVHVDCCDIFACRLYMLHVVIFACRCCL